MNRRELFAAGAFALSGVGAGCLDRPIGSEQDRPDPGDISIDGRLHNETDVSPTASDDGECEASEAAVELLVRLSFDADGPPADVVTVRVSGATDNRKEGFQIEAER